MVGRHAGQAPDIDGSVFLSGGEVQPGTLVNLTISQATDYDLFGQVDESIAPIIGKGRGHTSPTLVNRASDRQRVLFNDLGRTTVTLAFVVRRCCLRR